MRRLTLPALIAVIFLAVGGVSAQTDKQRQKSRYVLVPGDHTLMLIASQLECPLRVERAKVLVNVENYHDIIFQYDLRNAGSKPIKDFSVVFFSSAGNSGTLNDNRLKDRTLLPGEVISTEEESPARTVIPVTTELRRSLKLDSPVKNIVVLMIWTVHFSDGTTFSDEKNLKATRSFFEELDIHRN